MKKRVMTFAHDMVPQFFGLQSPALKAIAALVCAAALFALCSCTGPKASDNSDERSNSQNAAPVSASSAPRSDAASPEDENSTGQPDSTQPAADGSFSTPYYRIDLPESWGEAFFELDDKVVVVEVPDTSLYARAAYTKVTVDGGSFEVACFSETAGWQDQVVSRNLGTPAALPDWKVSVATQLTGKFASKIDELASFVTVFDQPCSLSERMDLGDPRAQYQLNRFLTVFSDTMECSDERSLDPRDAESLCQFAFLYDLFKNDHDIEHTVGSYNELLGLDPSTERHYFPRIPKAAVTETAQSLFGVSVNFGELPAPGVGSCCCDDEYVYSVMSQVPPLRFGVSRARNASLLWDGTFSIDFDVFAPQPQRYNGYDVNDASLYSSTAEQLCERFSLDGPIATGTAIVRIDPEGAGSLRLVSWNLKSTSSRDSSIPQ